MAERTCRKCDGMGMVIVERADGNHLAEACECRVERRIALLHHRSRIPERYARCTLDNFQRGFAGATDSIKAAFIMARRFVDNYPHGTEGTGLLFTGSVGTGKTHLAVGILQALVLEKGVKALFCDHRQLLKSIHNSYNPSVTTTEFEVLKPVFEAEVLVLDELGSAKKTEWVSDIVEHILNTRYNDRRTTIITTNYPSLPAGADRNAGSKQEPQAKEYGNPPGGVPAMQGLEQATSMDRHLDRMDEIEGRGKPIARPPLKSLQAGRGLPSAEGGDWSEQATAIKDKPRGAREETLGDRIGERMRSRLSEMCVTVEMIGEDYRQTARRARFL